MQRVFIHPSAHADVEAEGFGDVLVGLRLRQPHPIESAARIKELVSDRHDRKIEIEIVVKPRRFHPHAVQKRDLQQEKQNGDADARKRHIKPCAMLQEIGGGQRNAALRRFNRVSTGDGHHIFSDCFSDCRAI